MPLLLRGTQKERENDMKKAALLKTVVSLLVMCGITVGAVQYSEKLGIERAAALAALAEQQAREEAEAQAKAEAELQARVLAAEVELAELKEQSKAAQEKYDQEHPKGPGEFVPAAVYYPSVTPSDIQDRFNYYYSNYSNVVGYIYSPYTAINYPILRGTTVNDFYLSHDINGNEDINGCIVLEPMNSSSFTDDNTILYGHNMRSGAMFASLCNYKNSSYYGSHPYMYLLTPNQNYRIDLWAGIVCPHDDPVFATAHDSYNRQSFYNRSTFWTSLGAPEGPMVTLCTCSYEAYNYRYCVLGNLVPIS